jgi:hypothetical protein
VLSLLGLELLYKGYGFRGQGQFEKGAQALFEASRISHLTFPHHEDAPAQCAEGIQIPLISQAVAVDLRCPSTGVVDGTRRTLTPRVAMPKTAMNEDDFSVARQDDVRCTGKPLPVQSKSIPHGM